MHKTVLSSLVLFFSAAAVVLPSAHAATGEATAVITSCGTPDSDTYGTSEVSGLPMRTLVYGNFRLNFETQANMSVTPDSWQFTSGWRGHMPQTANEVAKQMTCFGTGLAAAQNAAAGQRLAADPSIALQNPAGSAKRAPFGVANLWIILFLTGIVAIFAVAIPRRKTMVTRPSVSGRVFRRPQLNVIRFRRRPKVPVTNRL
jgi:hypothetical protein